MLWVEGRPGQPSRSSMDCRNRKSKAAAGSAESAGPANVAAGRPATELLAKQNPASELEAATAGAGVAAANDAVCVGVAGSSTGGDRRAADVGYGGDAAAERVAACTPSAVAAYS